MHGVIASSADFTGASLVKADLTGADLGAAILVDVDLRQANLKDVRLAGARLTGAKVAGLIGTGTALAELEVKWLDTSTGGDGSRRIENGQIPGLISGLAPLDEPTRRYFGRGDVLRNATLQFHAGARIEIDSVFQDCTINLGEGTELVIGASGILADCEVVGAGNITVHGKFFERKSPGIVGPRRLSVSAGGAIVSSVAQGAQRTQFAFERGCQLRVKIFDSVSAPNDKPEVKA
jgi:hypothetical protein